VVIRDGDDATDDIVAVVEFAANGSGTQWFGPQGIPFSTGLFVDRVAGESEGVLYVG
jgi:hypothetical protein